MAVTSISNDVSSLNSFSNQTVGKSEQTSSIKNNDNFLELSINEYNKKRDELSNSLQAFNTGIGIAKTAQNGLTKQQKSLENIQNILTQASENQTSPQNNTLIKNGINQELQNFRNEAYQTKYNKQSLISIDDFNKETTIEVSTKEAYFSIEKPNTPLIATSISQSMKGSDFNKSEDLKNTLSTIEKGLNQLNNYQLEFEDLEKGLETSAKNSIKEQTDLLNENKKNKKIDYSTEVTDFSKSNINANSGYLIASQANIVQEQSVRLLT